MAASRRPEIHNGGCGMLTGRGAMVMSLTVLKRPWNVTVVSVHRRFINASDSLQRAPRSWTGTPHASNSRAISPPMPTPKLKRPFDATSSAAPSLANSAAG